LSRAIDGANARRSDNAARKNLTEEIGPRVIGSDRASRFELWISNSSGCFWDCIVWLDAADVVLRPLNDKNISHVVSENDGGVA